MLGMQTLHGILAFAILLGAKAQSEVTCEDSTASFLNANGDEIKCNRAKEDPWMQCKKIEMQANCPKTCNVCPVSFSISCYKCWIY